MKAFVKCLRPHHWDPIKPPMAAVLLLMTSSFGYAFTVDTSATALQMAQKLITGTPGCVTVANATYTGSPLAKGIFSGASADGLGIDSGVLLSTGKAAEAIGPNDSGSKTTDFGLAGDSALSSLAGYPTFDAAVLEFDVTPKSTVLEIKFTFGSEEYLEYVGSAFNDVFGFYVNGANIALVPQTSTRIAVNSVNNTQNAQYYRDNSVPPATYNVQYDGLTAVLTVYATVNPNVANHVKLAIADASDHVLDSGVFISGLRIVSRFTAYSLVGDGTFQFTLSTIPNSVNTIQASTDLSSWSTLASGVLASSAGTINYTDTPSIGMDFRFYRTLGGGSGCDTISANCVGFSKLQVPGQSGGNGGYLSVLPVFDLGADITLNKAFKLFTGGGIIPNGAMFYRWNSQSQSYDPVSTYNSSTLWTPNYTLQAGEGGFIRAPGTASFWIKSWGEVPQGQLVTSVPNAQSWRGSRIPQTGAIDALGYPPDDGDIVYLWDAAAQNFSISQYILGFGWDPATPILPQGRPALIMNGAPAKSWTRTFSAF